MSSGYINKADKFPLFLLPSACRLRAAGHLLPIGGTVYADIQSGNRYWLDNSKAGDP